MDQKQQNGRDLQVCWLDSGGEPRHVISQPFHFQGDSICGCVIIVNLQSWGFVTEIITELRGQKRGGKGVCQGPEQVSKHRSCLWLSSPPVSRDCWVGSQSVLYEQMPPWNRVLSTASFFSFCLWSAFYCEWSSCVVWAVTNCLAFKKNLRKLQIPGKKTCHFKFYIPLGRERLFHSKQCLMRESLCFLEPSDEGCNTLFSSVFYSKTGENASSLSLLWTRFECKARMKESSET